MHHKTQAISLKRAMMGALGSTAIGLFMATSAIGQTQTSAPPTAAQDQPARNSRPQPLNKLAQLQTQFENKPADAQAHQTARQQSLKALTELERMMMQPAGGQLSEAERKAQASISDA
jgi:hypothetical protein